MSVTAHGCSLQVHPLYKQPERKRTVLESAGTGRITFNNYKKLTVETGRTPLAAEDFEF